MQWNVCRPNDRKPNIECSFQPNLSRVQVTKRKFRVSSVHWLVQYDWRNSRRGCAAKLQARSHFLLPPVNFQNGALCNYTIQISTKFSLLLGPQKTVFLKSILLAWRGIIRQLTQFVGTLTARVRYFAAMRTIGCEMDESPTKNSDHHHHHI